MGTFDFNTATEQQVFDLIPAGEIAVVQLRIRPGDAGDDGLLKRSKSGEAEMLDCEFVVVEGKFAKRKFWSNMVVSGVTDGHATAGDITRSKLRAILESARGIKPTDVSEAAKKARSVAGYEDFDGLRFIAKIGVEKGSNGYKDKNVLELVITPEMKGWHQVEQIDKAATPSAPAAADGDRNKIVKPAWAS
jgi:hypothetical protein